MKNTRNLITSASSRWQLYPFSGLLTSSFSTWLMSTSRLLAFYSKKLTSYVLPRWNIAPYADHNWNAFVSKTLVSSRRDIEK